MPVMLVSAAGILTPMATRDMYLGPTLRQPVVQTPRFSIFDYNEPPRFDLQHIDYSCVGMFDDVYYYVQTSPAPPHPLKVFASHHFMSRIDIARQGEARLCEAHRLNMEDQIKDACGLDFWPGTTNKLPFITIHVERRNGEVLAGVMRTVYSIVPDAREIRESERPTIRPTLNATQVQRRMRSRRPVVRQLQMFPSSCTSQV